MKMALLLLATIGIAVASGCVQQQSEPDVSQKVVERCVNLCMMSSYINSSGPCLSDTISSWTFGDWVCDVAHSPRQAVDDLPENQCWTFRDGWAHHFVEIDMNCSVIRVV